MQKILSRTEMYFTGNKHTNSAAAASCSVFFHQMIIWTTVQIGRLSARPRDVSKPQDSGLDFSNRSEFFNAQSRDFKTSPDFGGKVSYSLVNRGPDSQL